jgi:hypothetical protein
MLGIMLRSAGPAGGLEYAKLNSALGVGLPNQHMHWEPRSLPETPSGSEKFVEGATIAVMMPTCPLRFDKYCMVAEAGLLDVDLKLCSSQLHLQTATGCCDETDAISSAQATIAIISTDAMI